MTLGSLRDRQDYLIFEGLLSPYTTGNEKPDILYQTALDAHPPARRARSRPHARPRPQLLRQHEGLDLGDGLSASAREAEARTARSTSRDAYPAQIGDWDKVAINYGYRQFATGTDEPAALTKILDDAWAQDLRYMTNQDTDIAPEGRSVVERRRIRPTS